MGMTVNGHVGTAWVICYDDYTDSPKIHRVVHISVMSKEALLQRIELYKEGKLRIAAAYRLGETFYKEEPIGANTSN